MFLYKMERMKFIEWNKTIKMHRMEWTELSAKYWTRWLQWDAENYMHISLCREQDE